MSFDFMASSLFIQFPLLECGNFFVSLSRHCGKIENHKIFSSGERRQYVRSHKDDNNDSILLTRFLLLNNFFFFIKEKNFEKFCN
jgi:hypothetical protein